MSYYGEYRSSHSSKGMCRSSFLTTPVDTSLMPVSVTKHCQDCGFEHNFHLYKTYLANTPKQKKNIEEHFSNQEVTINVKINFKK